jgi:hypothetical protein
MKKLLLASLLAVTAQDTRPKAEDCPECHGIPSAMQSQGVMSHGDFRFGFSDSRLVERIFKDELPIYWIEGEHVKLGFADTQFVFTDGRVAIGDQTPANGALALGSFKRVHAYLERCEALIDQIQGLLDVTDADFPELDDAGNLKPRDPALPYMGKGPHLGQAGKFEVLVLPGREAVGRYSLHANGLARSMNDRVLVAETDALSMVAHLQDGVMYDDKIVWANLAHVLTHNLIRGYKHLDYPTPMWLEIGLAHSIGREINHTTNTFCANPELAAQNAELNDWTDAVKDALRKDKGPYLERLRSLEHESDFELNDHLYAWSMTRFMITENPKGYAEVMDYLHGLTKGRPDIGIQTLTVAHRDAFAKGFDLTYEEFDAAWKKWAKKQKSQR